MSRYHWIIDAGHGGFKNGVYTTAPAKMHRFEDGLTIYEGDVNRKIAKLVHSQLQAKKFDITLVYDDVIDTSLQTRVMLANKVYRKNRNAVLLSIHSNASPDPARPAHGFEVFTSPGETKSDPFAAVFCKNYIKDLPQFKFRSDTSDGDYDKEARFYMLTQTHCPALLVENLFMDNRKEAEFLLSESGQLAIANVLVKSIVECESIPL